VTGDRTWGVPRVFALLLAGLVAPGAAHAQEVSASGSLGAGAFGAQPATTAEAGIDIAGAGYALGIGARGRWLAEGGFRGEEWDELSEQVGVIRYATAAWSDGEEGGTALSAALGELGAVSLGHGSIVGGYSSGLHVDHGHLGAQGRMQSGPVAGELLVDDLVAPRIGGARVAAEIAEEVTVGATVAGDRVAPAADGERAAVAAFAVDGELGARSEGDAARGALFADAVGIAGLAAGLHAGAAGDALVAGSVRLGARAELRAGSRHYVPGWVGPLYEIERRLMTAADGAMTAGQLEVARAGGLAGIGAAGALTASAAGIASGEIAVAARRGIADVVSARVLAPFHDHFQAGLWSAAALAGSHIDALALAAEARLELPNRLFLRADAARLVRDDDMGLVRPVWLVQLALGASLGD
jgi:hypothetical protein